MVEHPESGQDSLKLCDLRSFAGNRTHVKVPASFIREWLTKGRRGFKSLVTGSELNLPLIDYLGDIADSAELVNLQPFLSTIFGGIISPIAQRKISVFYVALVNLPVKPPINTQVKNFPKIQQNIKTRNIVIY